MKKAILALLMVLLFLPGCKKEQASYTFKLASATAADGGIKPVALEGRFGAVWGDNDFPALEKIGVTWARLFPGEFVWGKIEVYPDEYKWTSADAIVMEAENKGLQVVGSILPYNEADQDTCHLGYDFTQGPYPELGERRYMPCDTKAYARFVTALVERYDGDGYKDMPGLRYPIRHWEVLTEPDSKETYKIFFSGTTKEYYDLMKLTYEAIKRSDPASFVLNGGLSGNEASLDFWDEVLMMGGGDYFDIASIHSLSGSNSLNVKEMADILKSHGLKKKIWVTEASFCDKKRDEKEVAGLIVKSFVTAFANGADKIFYGCPSTTYSEVSLTEGNANLALSALHILIAKTDGFFAVEKITASHYKFMTGGRIVYVAWDNILPMNYNKIKVTSLDGTLTEMEISDLNTSGEPVFFEPIK